MKLFSKPVRSVLAFACVWSTVSPAFAAMFGTVPDNGTNISAGNRVISTSNASVHDYSPNLLEGITGFVYDTIFGANMSVNDMKSVTGVQLQGSVGVIRWDRFNVDAGKTMWIMNKNDTAGTLYNIVVGGAPTTIGGNVLTQLDNAWAQGFAQYHNLIGGEGLVPGSGAVNVWFINPAGISVSSGASINLNGYLGLVSGSAVSMDQNVAKFNTDNSPGAITIESGASIRNASGVYLVGNRVEASALIEADALVANGNDVVAKSGASSIGQLTSSQSTIDKMYVSGIFRKSLGICAARNLELGDLSVSSVATLAAKNGKVSGQGNLRFYDTSGRSTLTAQGDITVSGGSVANNSLLTITSQKGDITLDSDGNDFKGGLKVSAAAGQATIGGTRLTDQKLIVNTLGDISLHEYDGGLTLPANNGNYQLTMSDPTAKLSLAADKGSIVLNNVRGWNGRLGKTSAIAGDVTVSTSQRLVLLGDVGGRSVSLTGSGIETGAEAGTLLAQTGDITLKSKAGIDVTGGWKVQAENGAANFVNESSGELVIGQSYLKADGQRVEVTAKRVAIEQKAAQDLVIEESATVHATGQTEENGGMKLSHAGDLYVFGNLTVDLPDPDKGFDPETARPLGYLLPEIVSTGNGRVKAMSLDMRNRDYSLSEVRDAMNAFGTWDNLEYVRFYNLGANFIVDKNMRLVTASAGTRTGNRASTVFEGKGDMTVTLPGTELHAEQTGLRLSANGTLTLAGAGGLIETGEKSLNLAGTTLANDGQITIKAGALELSDGIEADLSNNRNVYVDRLAGTAANVTLKANAYLDAEDFRLSGDFKANTLTLDTGRTAATRRNFIGGDAAYGAEDDQDLYKLNVGTLEIALKDDAKLYFKSDRYVTVSGIADSPGAEKLTTVADLRYSSTAGLHLDGNRASETLTVTSLGDTKASGDIYLRETHGSMDVTKPVATKGAATFIASNDGATLSFADAPNDIGGEIRIAGSAKADIAFANYGTINLRRVSGNDVTLESVNGDITLSSESAFVQGLLTLTAGKGNVTVGSQSAETGLWSGRLGAVTAQGTVDVATGRKLVLEGNITAGDAVLSGVKGIETDGGRILLTNQNKTPHDEYVHNTSGRLTVRADRGSVSLGGDGAAQHVEEFVGTARDGIEFRNDQNLTVGKVTVSGGEANLASVGDIKVVDAVTAYDVTLHAAEKIEFSDDGFVAVRNGTRFVVDFADLTLDLQAIQSRDMRESWNLGKISAQAGSEDNRRNVTIVGNDSSGFSVGEIVADRVTLVSQQGLSGGKGASIRSLSGVELQAANGDIDLVGAQAIEGVVTAEAAEGNIRISTAGTLTVGDMAAKAENGLIDLGGDSILSDGYAKRTLAAATLNLRAVDDILLDLAGDANLNRVTAKNARLTALDDGASLTIADGSVGYLSALTAGDLSVVNDRDLGLGAVTAGGTANFSVRGTLAQDGTLDEAGRMDIGGKATFTAKDDLFLDNPYNAFGSTLLATAGGAAVFSRETGGFVFEELTAKDAEIYAGSGAGDNIVVTAGDVESLMAEAGGSLTFANARSLTLRAIDVDALNVSTPREITGAEKIVVRSGTARFDAPSGITLAYLSAKDAKFVSSEGDITVTGGSIEALAANAAGRLTVANDQNLTLKDVDVQSFDLVVAGRVDGTDQIVTRATANRPNRMTAADGVSLTHRRNQFGEALEVRSDGLVNLVNVGDFALSVDPITKAYAKLNIANDGTLDVTASKVLAVGVLASDRLSVNARQGLWGDENSRVTVLGKASLKSSEGGVKLVGANTFADTVTVSAPKGSVALKAEGDLKVGDLTASTEAGHEVALAASMITGDGRVRLTGAQVNLEAGRDGRIELDFLGSADLNRVVSDVAIFTSDGSLAIADGSVATLTATTGNHLELSNDRDITLAGVSVGGDALFDVDGKIGQRPGEQLLVQGDSIFIATSDICLDGNYNRFGKEILAETGGLARFNTADDLDFAYLSAKDANLTALNGKVNVSEGSVDTLAAQAGGALTVANDKDLTLKGVEAKTMSLEVAGKVVGHDRIVTEATASNPNVIVATDVITLDNEKNLLTAVKVDTPKAVSLTDDGALYVTTRKALEVGSIVAESIKIEALNGMHGDAASKVVSDDRLELTATYNDIYLDGTANAFQTLAARAPNGSVHVRNSKSTKLEELVVDEEGGKAEIVTAGTLTGDGKIRLNGRASFEAEDIRIDFAGSADLDVVKANTVRLTALDDGASIVIENGNMNVLAAQTAQDLTVWNGKDLALGEITVGRNESFDIAGSLTQRDDALMTVAGTSKLKTTGDLVLDSAGNHFGGGITADVGGNAAVNAADGLSFAGLAAGDVALATAAGDVTVAQGAIRGTLTAAAAAGNVFVDNGDNNLTIGDIAASPEGQVALKARNLASTGPVSLDGGTVDLTADESIDLAFKGSAQLNRVTAESATLKAEDAGASLAIADGSLGRLSATVAGDLTAANDRDLVLGATAVGGKADLNVAGTLAQDAALAVGGETNLKATDIVLDHADNAFNTIVAEAVHRAVLAADGLNIVRLAAAEADLRGGVGDIIVAEGQVDRIAALADGNLTMANGRDLELGAVDVAAVVLAVEGNLSGNGPVLTRSTDQNPNVLAATGAITLGNAGNDFGDVLDVAAGGPVTLANTGDLRLLLENDGTFDVLNNGNLLVGAGNVKGGRFETRGGDLTLNAQTLGSDEKAVEVASDRRIVVSTQGDASLSRTDGGWTLGPNGGYLSIGGNLALRVNGTLGTEGDGVLAAKGDIKVRAHDYKPMVALGLGGRTLDAGLTSDAPRPQWAMFRTVPGSNPDPDLVAHYGVWVVINGHLTPTYPDYAYAQAMEQDRVMSTPELTPTAPVFGTRYFASDRDLCSIDLVGLGRYPYVVNDPDSIEFTTKE